MSLINEALKKAQKMRQVEPVAEGEAPAGEAAHAPRVPKRRTAVQAKNVVIATGCVVIAFALAGGAAFMFLLPDTTPPEIVRRPTPKAASPAAMAKADAGVPTVAVPTSLTSPEASTAETSMPAPDAAPTTDPAQVEIASAPATQTTEPPVAAPQAEPAAPPPPQPVENLRVYEFLDTLRVTGIRASATDPKVLMNDRVFRLDDIVDRTLGLRITGISPEGLTFTDETGFEYRKNF